MGPMPMTRSPSARDRSRVSINVIAPRIRVVKDVDREVILAGEYVTYSYRVTNPGDDPLGQVTVATTSLMDRQEAYFLPVELARRKLSQLRNQTAEWELSGVKIPDPVRHLTAEAMKRFGQATCRQTAQDSAAEAAADTLRLALDAGHLLAEAYSSQVLATLREEQPAGVLTQKLAEAGMERVYYPEPGFSVEI